MALQTSGTITFAQLQSNFGGANPIGMNEYYRGGANVPTTVGTAAGAWSSYGPNHVNYGLIKGQGYTGGATYTMRWVGSIVYAESTTNPFNSSNIAYNIGGYDYQFNATAWTINYPGKYGTHTYWYHAQRRRVTGSSVTVNTGIPASGAISMNQFYGGRNT